MTERAAKMGAAWASRWLYGDQVLIDKTVSQDANYKAAKEAERKQTYPEMLEHAKALAEQYPKSSLAQKCLSDALYYGEDFQGAYVAINKAIEIAPNDVVAWLDLGTIYAALQKPQDAETAYKTALSIDSDNPMAWADLASEVYLLQGRNEEAASATDHALRLLQTNPFNTHGGELEEWGVWYSVGENYNQLMRSSDAVTALENASNLERNNASILDALGQGYLGTQRNSDAVNVLERATKMEPDYADALYWLGCGYLRLQRPADAMNALKHATTLDPKDAHVWYTLGASYTALNQPADAVSALEHATNLAPSRPDMWSALGQAYAASGNSDAAKTAYQHAAVAAQSAKQTNSGNSKPQ